MSVIALFGSALLVFAANDYINLKYVCPYCGKTNTISIWKRANTDKATGYCENSNCKKTAKLTIKWDEAHYPQIVQVTKK